MLKSFAKPCLFLLIILLFFSGVKKHEHDCLTLKASGTTRVMTFNIRYDNPMDSIWKWQYRKELVVKTIEKNSPDLLGLQEVLHSQLLYLQKELTAYGSYGVGRENGKEKGEYAAVFYKKDKYELVKGGNFWLSPTPAKPSLGWDAACIRIVTWVKLKEKKSGTFIYHFNTHFDHVSRLAQLNSARLILDSIRQISGNSAFVLTGDFNVTDTSGAYRILTTGKPLLYDSRKYSESMPWGQNCSFTGFPCRIVEGYIIDFVFIPAGKFRVLGIKTGKVQTSTVYPSDHLPVMATLL